VDKIIKKAKDFLASKNLSFDNIDLISFSRGPGLGNSLKVGALLAKTLAIKYDKPIVGVNHIKAHLEFGKMLTGAEDPIFLMVSGVNTQIIAKDEFNSGYKIYGETEDIGLGNLLDSFARMVGLDFPGGPIIEKLAKKSNNYIELPYAIKGMNVNLAGIYSTLKQQLDKGAKVEDLCYSLQETAFSMLMEIVERAVAYTKKKSFIIVGGVSANQRLTEMAKNMCKLRGIDYYYFDLKYAMDNGAMIAWQGYIDRNRATKNIKNLKPTPYITVENKI
jgi:N6-L-threonylcarbamoyladenine synthase/protein kinase Bud32